MKCGVMGGRYFFWWEESKDTLYPPPWHLETLMQYTSSMKQALFTVSRILATL